MGKGIAQVIFYGFKYVSLNSGVLFDKEGGE